MTRLQLNRTAWTGLTLFLLSINPLTLNADEPEPADPAKQQLIEQQLLEKEYSLKKIQASLIQKEIDLRTDQLRKKRNQLRRLTEISSTTHSSLNKEDRSKLIGNAIQSLHEIRTNIAVNKHLIKHLKESLKTAKPPVIQLASADAKKHVLRKQYQLAKDEENSVIELVKTGRISTREAVHIQIECEQIKAKMIEAEFEEAVLIEIAKKPIVDKISALKIDITGSRIKETITEEHLQELSSGSMATDILVMQHQIDSRQQQIQLWQKKLNEIRLEMCLLKARL